MRRLLCLMVVGLAPLVACGMAGAQQSKTPVTAVGPVGPGERPLPGMPDPAHPRTSAR